MEEGDHWGSLTFCDSIEEACLKSNAIALLTEWEEFKDLDFQKIYQSMEKPAYIFDGRNLLNLRELEDHSSTRANPFRSN